ncbi:MAG: isocitrate/isopropylmalate dehydrogenase family protein [Candidatus Nanohaloarchaea archaeon]|nr:isocitrate/isopropylmalate dehydrogenase family protein [Candidatus Nanohaloarchaea archaeon]
MEAVLIEGDGIGPEVVQAAKRCIEATAPKVEFEKAYMGEEAQERFGTPLPDETVSKVEDAGFALKGPVKTPVGYGFRSVNVQLRKRLELYANIRPCRYMKGVKSRINSPEDIDIVVVRENLEDVYSGIEFEKGTNDADEFREFLEAKGFETLSSSSSGYSVKPISETRSENIIRHAFEYAERNGREKVTAVDKANIMKYTDGLFMEVGERVSEDFDVEYEHLIVDNVAQQLVVNPEQFDVIVTQNLYGDILSDLAAGLVGGIGLVPSANIGKDNAVFASTHGTAPDIAGENIANPSSLIFSSAMMLDRMGFEEESREVRVALEEVIGEGKHVTGDLGGDATTEEMTDAVVKRINS